MEDGTESKGFLSRSNTEEATQAKADKLSGRISEVQKFILISQRALKTESSFIAYNTYYVNSPSLQTL